MNNKGFMMAEVIVVSSIILITLTALYTSYNKIIAAYNQRIDYYDIKTLYELAYIKEDINSLVGKSPNEIIYNQDKKQVYYTNKNNIPSLKNKEINPTFKDYLDFLNSSLDIGGDNRLLVMERCIDNDNCKYAYLEVEE